MADRALWRGAVSFGLLYVPVELHSAARDGALSLHLLDSRDFSPVGYERVNKRTGKVVAWGDIVKGYEYRKGEYVALSEADFKHANAKASETIDISNFSDGVDIPPMYYETPYLLVPGKGGAKVYALLREALKSTKKVAVATFVMRGRQHLCVVVAQDRALMLITLRFPDELKAPQPTISAGESKLSPAELSMARKLIDEMTTPWKPERFKDTYRADLMRRIREKIRKKQIHTLDGDATAEKPAPKAEVIDLMEALRNSLKGRPAKSTGGAARKRA